MQGVQEGVETRGMVLVGGANMVGLDSEDAAREMRKMLGRKEGPTAIVCATDTLAGGVIRACYAAGMMIPTGMSVTGVGDGDFAQHGVVPLTTVRFPSLGRLGFELWKKGRDDLGEMKPILAKGELVVRGSTAKPNQ